MGVAVLVVKREDGTQAYMVVFVLPYRVHAYVIVMNIINIKWASATKMQ